MTTLLEKINKTKKTHRLGDLVVINNESVTSHFPYKEIEYIDTSSVTQNIFDAPQVLKINEAPSRAKRLVRDGDTIISTVRPSQKHFGYIKNPKENTVVSTGFAVVTPKQIDPLYLYSYLTQNSTTAKLSAIAEATTTTFPAFRPEVLEAMEIRIPDLAVQKKIGEILSAYDAKIKNNNLIVKNLGLMTQTIFDKWFAKLKPSKKVQQAPGGIESKSLDEVADILFGFPFKANLFNEEGSGAKVVRIRDVLSGITDTYSPEQVEEKYKIHSGDILIGMDGIFHMSMWFSDDCYLNQRVVRIRSELPAYFIFESIRAQLNFLQKTITGATVGHLSNGDIRNFRILVPNDLTILASFRSATAKILELKKESHLLERLRDQLLAKLI